VHSSSSIFFVASRHQQILLANQNVSAPFADTLLTYLGSRLTELQDSREKEVFINDPLGDSRASVMLQLFKMSFSSNSIFPDGDVAVKHVKALVTDTLALLPSTRNPTNLLANLRSLFRSLTGVYGGCFENAYDELQSSLPALLSTLLRLRNGLDLKQVRVQIGFSCSNSGLDFDYIASYVIESPFRR
jgi:hypothetical protein